MGGKVDSNIENEFTNSQEFRELAVWCTNRALRETYPFTTLPNDKTKITRRQKLQDGYWNTPLRPSIQLYQNALTTESTEKKQNPIRRPNANFSQGKSRWKDSNKAFHHHAKPSAAIRSYNNLNAYSRKRKIDHKLLVPHITSNRCHVDRPFKGNLLTQPNSGKIQYVSVGFDIHRDNEKEISNVATAKNKISNVKEKLEKCSETSVLHNSVQTHPPATQRLRFIKHKGNKITNKRLHNAARVPFPVSILEIGKSQPISEGCAQGTNTPANQNLFYKEPFRTHKVLKVPHTQSLNTTDKKILCSTKYSPIQVLRNIDTESSSSTDDNFDILNDGASEGNDDTKKGVHSTDWDRNMQNKTEYKCALPKKPDMKKMNKGESINKKKEGLPLLINNNFIIKAVYSQKANKRIYQKYGPKNLTEKESIFKELTLPIINKDSYNKTQSIDRAESLLNIKENLKQLNHKMANQKFTRERIQQII